MVHNMVQKISILLIYCIELKLEGLLNRCFLASPLALMTGFKQFGILLTKNSQIFQLNSSICSSNQIQNLFCLLRQLLHGNFSSFLINTQCDLDHVSSKAKSIHLFPSHGDIQLSIWKCGKKLTQIETRNCQYIIHHTKVHEVFQNFQMYF